jgi:predicted  nucleic acid-binding Zn-ribbon protein
MIRSIGSVALILVAVSSAWAQDATAVDQRIEALRAQLRDVTDKETQLQAREQQLDEELKPENIEHSLSGVGTTDASALRDQRRQQLEREKAGVEEQLQSLTASRTHLEASIESAEAEAVRLKAARLGANGAPQPTENAASTPAASPAQSKQTARQVKRRRHKRVRRGTH